MFRFLKYAQSDVVHWTQKYDQEVHKDYPIHCYDERYEIIAAPI